MYWGQILENPSDIGITNLARPIYTWQFSQPKLKNKLDLFGNLRSKLTKDNSNLFNIKPKYSFNNI